MLKTPPPPTTDKTPAEEKPAGASQHWFWRYVIGYRRVYYQVIGASVMINLFALVSSLYIMTVYDRVIPNNATESLFVLTIIVIIVMAFDFTLKICRGNFVDHAGTEIDKRVSSDLFDRYHAIISACRGRPQARSPTRCVISRFSRK